MKYILPNTGSLEILLDRSKKCGFGTNIYFMTYYTIYKTTNMINDMIYIGYHSTENLNDAYLGSGSQIQKAIKEYGKQNFKKAILFVFDNKEEMLQKERELVNTEFASRQDTYNVLPGGGGFSAKNCVAVRDSNGNNMLINKNDPRYLSGELVAVSKGRVVVKDKDNNYLQVSVNDPRYISGELVHMTTGLKLIIVKRRERKQKIKKIKIPKEKKIRIKIKSEPKERPKHYIRRKSIVNNRGENNSVGGKIGMTHTETYRRKYVTKAEVNLYIESGWIVGWIKKTNRVANSIGLPN